MLPLGDPTDLGHDASLGGRIDRDRGLASSVARADVVERLGGLAQRKAAVEHRRDLAGFDQLREVEQAFMAHLHEEVAEGLAPELEQHLALDDPTATGHPRLVEAAAVRHQHPGRREGTAQVGQRVVRHVVEDEVVLLAALGEVFLRVVDDVVRADRADQLHVPRADDRGHLGAEGLGDLDREGADAARGAVDQDLLARVDLAVVAHGLEGDETGHRHGRCLLEGEARGLGRKLVLSRGRVLGVRALGRSVDLVTDAEAGDGGADGLDDARDIRSPGGDLRLAQAVDGAGDVRAGRS